MEWYLPNQVLRVQVLPELNVQTFDQVINEVLPWLDRAQKPLHVMIDFSKVTEIRFSFAGMLRSVSAARYFHHPRLGWTCYVAEHDQHYYYLMASFMEKEYGARIQWTACLSDAEAFLKKQAKNAFL